MAELLAILSRVSGLPESTRRFPSVFPLIAGHLSSFIEGDVLRREPRVPLEAAQMASTTMTFDDAKARREIGYTSRPAAQALYESARWFVEHGYVDVDRTKLIAWRPPSGD
jgi:dihydroflavonol-4-reductase